MSLFERGTKRWTGSPAAPVGFGAAKARCPVNRWRGRSGRKRSGWSAATKHVNKIGPLNGLSELRFGAIFKGVTDKGI